MSEMKSEKISLANGGLRENTNSGKKETACIKRGWQKEEAEKSHFQSVCEWQPSGKQDI